MMALVRSLVMMMSSRVLRLHMLLLLMDGRSAKGEYTGDSGSALSEVCTGARDRMWLA